MGVVNRLYVDHNVSYVKTISTECESSQVFSMKFSQCWYYPRLVSLGEDLGVLTVWFVRDLIIYWLFLSYLLTVNLLRCQKCWCSTIMSDILRGIFAIRVERYGKYMRNISPKKQGRYDNSVIPGLIKVRKVSNLLLFAGLLSFLRIYLLHWAFLWAFELSSLNIFISR